MTRLGLGKHIGGLARRPSMLVESVRAFFAMRRHGRLTPSAAYLGWRAHTAYGDYNTVFAEDDLFHYLEWRRSLRMLTRRRWRP